MIITIAVIIIMTIAVIIIMNIAIIIIISIAVIIIFTIAVIIIISIAVNIIITIDAIIIISTVSTQFYHNLKSHGFMIIPNSNYVGFFHHYLYQTRYRHIDPKILPEYQDLLADYRVPYK